VADGDYERGRGREIAAIAARLKRLAAERDGRKAVPPSVSGASRPGAVSAPARPDTVSGASRPGAVSAPARPDTVSGASRPGVLVLNGWASSPHAWDLCGFMSRLDGGRLFSYVDQLAGAPERFLSDGAPSDRRFVLVGWSMGGSGALRLACRFPDRVAGLVLVAATPRMMEDKEAGWRGMSPRRLEALRKGLEITHGEGFFGVPEGKPNPYMVDAPENLEGGLKYLLETDVRADLERAAAAARYPVHVFQSERDGIVRAENAVYLKSVFPQARVTVVPGTEHALPIMVPKEIDDAVDACLAVAAQG